MNKFNYFHIIPNVCLTRIDNDQKVKETIPEFYVELTTHIIHGHTAGSIVFFHISTTYNYALLRNKIDRTITIQLSMFSDNRHVSTSTHIVNTYTHNQAMCELFSIVDNSLHDNFDFTSELYINYNMFTQTS